MLEAVSTEEEPILVVQTGKGSQVRKAKFKIAKDGGCDGMESSWRQARRLHKNSDDGVGD